MATLATSPPPGGGVSQLYSLDVYVYGLRGLTGVPTSTNPCVAFRLWDFPTLFVRPDLNNREGHRRGTEAADGAFLSMCFESGKSCLFQVRPDELAPCLPLTLHVLFIDEVNEGNRTVLGSHAFVIGDSRDPLKCTISRGQFPLADVLGNKVGTMTIDVRLTCLGNSAIPQSLQTPPRLTPAAAAAAAPPGTPGQPRNHIGGQPTYIRDASGRFVQVSNTPLSLANLSPGGSLLGAPPGIPGQQKKKRRAARKYYPEDSSEASVVTEDSVRPHAGTRVRHSKRGRDRRNGFIREYDSDAASSGSLRKYLRYEVLAQLATIMTLVEEYVESDKRLGRIDQYSLEEQSFFEVEIGLLKNLGHNTNKVLSAVDQFCYSHHGSSALGIPQPGARPHTPHRRERSRERVTKQRSRGSRYSSDSPPPPPPPEEDRPRSKQEKASTEEKGKDSPGRGSGEKGDGGDAKAKEAEAERMQSEKEKEAEGAKSGKGKGSPGNSPSGKDTAKRQAEEEEAAREKREARAKERAREDEAEEEERMKRKMARDAAREEEDREEERQRQAADARRKERDEEDALAERKRRDADEEERRALEQKERMKREEDDRLGQEKRDREKRDMIERERREEEEKQKQKELDKQATATSFAVGDSVRVRDSEREDWRQGTATTSGTRPLVKVNGQTRSFQWNFVEASATKPQYAPGDRVKVRDSEKEAWRKGTVKTVSGSRVTVCLQGHNNDYVWNLIEPDKEPDVSEKPPAAAAADEFSIGDRVRVRDTVKEEWRIGTVQSLKPAQGGARKPWVCIDGQLREFSWNFIEKLSQAAEKKEAAPKFNAGDRVRVRDTEYEAWQPGAVVSVSSTGKVSVRVDSMNRIYTWNHVEADENYGKTSSSASESSSKSGKSTGSEASQIFSVGTRVRVRDSTREEWKLGEVESIADKRTKVRLDGQARAFLWQYVERVEDTQQAASSSSSSSSSASSTTLPPSYQTGDRVRVRDTDREEWRLGTVETVNGSRVAVKIDGQFKAFTWNFIEPVKGGGKEAAPKAASSTQLRVGDRVRVRDSDRDAWKVGTVRQEGGSRPMVVVDGQQKAFTWSQYEKMASDNALPATGSKSPQKESQWNIGDRVKVRDSERDQWRSGTVTGMSGADPLVKIDGGTRPLKWELIEKDVTHKVGDRVLVRDSDAHKWQKAVVEKVEPKLMAKVDGAARAFGWAMVKRDDEPAASSASKFAAGDRVRFRDSERDDWKKGAVESINRAGKPVVKGDGQSRSFTWNFVEKDTSTSVSYQKGDKVRVRDSSSDDWKQGTVESLSNGQPKVRIGGAAMAFTWNLVEKVEGGKVAGQFAIGDTVRVRDRTTDEWKKGTVKSAGPKPMVATTTGTFMWTFVEHDAGDTPAALPPKSKASELPAATPAAASSPATYNVGARVQVRDLEKDPWKRGVVVTASGSKPSVRVEGSDRSFTWNFYKHDTDQSPLPEKYKPGDRVLVRDNDREDWKEGLVESAYGSNPTVKLLGQKTGFTWTQVKRFAYSVGDRVRVRDTPREEWKEGTVDSVNGDVIKVRVGSQRAFTWNEIQRF